VATELAYDYVQVQRRAGGNQHPSLF
jgi:hypothetical protein